MNGGASQIKRSSFPTMGQFRKDQLKDGEQPERKEVMVQRYVEQW
ncbi:hypothetical Protein YC6258_01453 [Gynuella sunshinyii YC6258]|uniref:Uncharacterized protein n=1 Tax=Gynuella sunshinyii YC6258 TaxID=1445510 RepID=A0A0C5VGZ5_9GAMM|nr:hypothetical Protein YC6258_01453 [Gynuella sunshinyii YC6258]